MKGSDEIQGQKGQMDVVYFHCIGRLDFKKLGRATSGIINSEDEKHGGSRVWLEIQTRRKRVL